MKNDSHFYTDYTGVGLEHQWMGDKKNPALCGRGLAGRQTTYWFFFPEFLLF